MGARSNSTADRELVIKRILDAPRELVFKAWTDPEHLMRWWGPHGHKLVSCKVDVRAAGAWRFCMVSPTGLKEWQRGAYREVVPPERLVFSYGFEDASGHPSHESVVTVTFAEQSGKTALTLHQAVFESVAVRDDHVRGWGEALDRLGEYVAQTAGNHPAA
jgi:uncharacterized protein YndB with AHSA1/START domain